MIDNFVKQQQLPPHYVTAAEQWFVPLAERLAARKKPGKPLFVGVCGAQGTGKSTLALLLQTALEEQANFTVAQLSIDDFYLTRAARQQLAADVHPLLATRGVPGTHDMDLLQDVLGNLGDLAAGGQCALPRFDKSVDDRAPAAQFDSITGPVDVIILEGWCIGFAPGDEDSGLEQPVNTLEREQDPDASWRRFVNDALRSGYPAVFNSLDYLVYLKAPDFSAVCRWRRNQEHKLASRSASDSPGIMTDEELDRFMMLFERCTLNNDPILTDKADEVFYFDQQQRICDHTAKSGDIP